MSSREGRNLGTEVVGLSSYPADVVTSEQCPLETISTDSTCTVVDGVLSLFYRNEGDGDTPSTKIEEDTYEIKAAIESLMENGDLIHEMDDPDLIDLKYIVPITISSDDTVDSLEGNEGEGEGGSLGVKGVSFITAGSIVTILLLGATAFKWVQTRRRARGDVSVKVDNNNDPTNEAIETALR